MGDTPEAKVKRVYAQVIDDLGGMNFNPIGGRYATDGVSDHISLVQGIYVATEAKADAPDPTPIQWKFLRDVFHNGGVIGCVGAKLITPRHGVGKRNPALVGASSWFMCRGVGDVQTSTSVGVRNIRDGMRTALEDTLKHKGYTAP